jgi:hypothetical protein
MDRMRNLRLEFRRDGGRDRDCFVYLKADLPDGHPLRGRTGCGSGGIEFFFHRPDFERFTSCGRDSFTDCYVRLEVCGSEAMFSDGREIHDCSRATRERQIAEVPFFVADIPQFVRTWMGKVARRVWDNPTWKRESIEGQPGHYAATSVRPVVMIPDAARARFARLYGQGKGRVLVDMDAETQKRLEHVVSIATIRQDATFGESLARVKQIALNSTRGHHQTARVYLRKDFDGFYWVAYTPRGKAIMNGGIVYHGPHDAYGSAGLSICVEPTSGWSVHT